MNDDRQQDMARATRLTRNGKLAEATAVIQRSLGQGRRSAPPAPPAPTTVGLRALMPGGDSTAGDVRDKLQDRLRRPRSIRPNRTERPRSSPLAGQFLNASHSGASGARKYKLYLPSGYTGAPLPLVLMLHGGTQNAENFAAGTRMNRLAEQGEFLVAYPEQSSAANQMQYWNWFQPVNQRRGVGEPALIAGITADIRGRYAVDEGRVYVAGFSAGGAMAAVMAATYPDVYAAAGVHSGLPYGSAHDVASAFAVMREGPSRNVALPGRAVPLIVFHGDQDQTVDRINASRLVDQWRSVAATGQRSATPAVHRLDRPGGRSYTRSEFTEAGGQVAVEQWLVHGGGHAWFGGGPEGTYTDPLGPDASAEIIGFFARHQMPPRA